MNQLLFYLLQVIAASGLLYGYYHFALRNKKFHRYNRFYLLIAIVASSLIPFPSIPVYFSSNETGSSVVLQTLQVISSPAVKETISPVLPIEPVNSTWFTAEKLVYLFYVLAFLLFLIRVLISLNKIRDIINRNPAEQIDKIKFINTDEPGTPFSFFRWLFWNRKIELHSEKGEQIFRHELFHIQQKHSWDIIFMELVSTIFWINPFFHLIKKELKAIHEFLADEFAIKEDKNWQYAELLLMQVLNTNNHLVNPFFHNQIKRRIAMITTSKKPSYQYLRKLMVFPVAAIIFFLFAFNYKNKQTDPREFEKGNQISNLQRAAADTSKQLQNALVVINGVVQEKKGIQNIDTTKFPGKEFKGEVKISWGKEAIDKYGEKGKDGVIEFFYDQNGNQIIDTIPKVDTVYWLKEIPIPKRMSPTAGDLKTWEDAKMYGVWIDASRISNGDLRNHKPSEFGWYNVSKLARNAVNYGKHYYQVSLYTQKYYDEKIAGQKERPVILVKDVFSPDATKPGQLLIVINGQPMPGLKIAALDETLSPGDIESMTILKKDTATKKYGENGKNGAIEIKTKKMTPIAHKNKTVKEIRVNGEVAQDDDNKVFEKMEIEPSFPGGVTAWRKFLSENINATVPVDSGSTAGTFTVVLQFIVDKKGNISDIKPTTKLGFGMEQECIRVMKLSPNWIPARQNGQVVKAYRKQPFTFMIVEEVEDNDKVEEVVVTGNKIEGKPNNTKTTSKPGKIEEVTVTGYKINKAEVDKLSPIFPNPATNSITILYDSKAEVNGEIRVYDISSSLKMVSKTSLKKGRNNASLNVSSLANGTYIINVVDVSGKILNVYKMIKQ